MTDAISGLWTAFAGAIEAEPRSHTIIRGASGIDHAIEAIAIDENRKRMIIVSADSDPRVSVLVQNDIQATVPYKVLMARPITVDLAHLAQNIITKMGVEELDIVEVGDELKALEGQPLPVLMNSVVGGALVNLVDSVISSKLPPLRQIVAFLEQLPYVDWQAMGARLQANSSKIPLQSLLAVNNISRDLNYGICPIPLYEFQTQEWERILAGGQSELVREKMKEVGLFQYFFPAVDHLALGLIDRGITSKELVIRAIEATPTLGHPFGKSELLTSPTSLVETVESLNDLGFLTEGESTVEITPEGTVQRATVKFRPREGLLSKLLARFNVNVSVSPRDLIPPGSL